MLHAGLDLSRRAGRTTARFAGVPLSTQNQESVNAISGSTPISASKSRRCASVEHDPGVANRPLIVKRDAHAVQSDRSFIVHHEGDLLRRAAHAPRRPRFIRRYRCRSVFAAPGQCPR